MITYPRSYHNSDLQLPVVPGEPAPAARCTWRACTSHHNSNPLTSDVPGEPAPAGTDEPADGEEGGEDVEHQHPEGHDEDGHVELVRDTRTLEVDTVHITVDSLNIYLLFMY